MLSRATSKVQNKTSGTITTPNLKDRVSYKYISQLRSQSPNNKHESVVVFHILYDLFPNTGVQFMNTKRQDFFHETGAKRISL